MKDYSDPIIDLLKVIITVLLVCAMGMATIKFFETNSKHKYQMNLMYSTLDKNILCFEIQISSYQLNKDQTDSNPKESASGKNLTKHPNACAISRDLKGILNFGDTITLLYNGVYKDFIVEDVMNKRFTSKVDILTDKDINCKGFLIKK